MQLPSKAKGDYWIESESPHGVWSDKPGKWLLFIPTPRIDQVWGTIDRETKSGRLGIAAKVATAKRNSLAKSQSVRLICVYTYNCEDLDDVRLVRQRLRNLGFTKKIPYKSDAATAAGIYTANGDKNVSLLYE